MHDVLNVLPTERCSYHSMSSQDISYIESNEALITESLPHMSHAISEAQVSEGSSS